MTPTRDAIKNELLKTHPPHVAGNMASAWVRFLVGERVQKLDGATVPLGRSSRGGLPDADPESEIVPWVPWLDPENESWARPFEQVDTRRYVNALCAKLPPKQRFVAMARANGLTCEQIANIRPYLPFGGAKVWSAEIARRYEANAHRLLLHARLRDGVYALSPIRVYEAPEPPPPLPRASREVVLWFHALLHSHEAALKEAVKKEAALKAAVKKEAALKAAKEAALKRFAALQPMLVYNPFWLVYLPKRGWL